MKRYFMLFAAVMFLVSANVFAQDKAINLKFNLANGETYSYNLDMDMTTKGSFSGQNINVHNVITVGYIFKVTGDSAGWKKINATFSKIAMSINTNGMNIDYDSDKPDDTSNVVNNTLGKILGALKGGQFVFTMNENGDIGYVTGINELVDKMTASAPGGSSMAAGMSNAFNEESFKQNLKQAFGIYPGKPVRPGDSWMNTTNTVSSGAEIKFDNTYTLESVSGNVATVKEDSKLSTEGDSAKAVTSGSVTGTLTYDIPSGIAVDGNLTTNMNMDVNAGGQSIPMTIGINTKITGKKS